MDAILIDLVIAAALLFTFWSGYRKGFVLTLCGFLAVFVALIGATICSSMFAPPVADVITPVLEQTIEDALDDGLDDILASLNLEDYLSAAVNGGSELLDGLEEQLPLDSIPLDDIVSSLTDIPLLHRMAESFQNAVDSGLVDVTSHAAGALASFIALQLARVVIFILAFFLINIAWFFLSHTLNLAFKLPVLSTANALFGGAVGLVKGLVLVCIAVWLLKDTFIPAELVNDSILMPFFVDIPAKLLSMFSQ